jgi:hypothetical protein
MSLFLNLKIVWSNNLAKILYNKTHVDRLVFHAIKHVAHIFLEKEKTQFLAAILPEAVGTKRSSMMHYGTTLCINRLASHTQSSTDTKDSSLTLEVGQTVRIRLESAQSVSGVKLPQSTMADMESFTFLIRNSTSFAPRRPPSKAEAEAR